MQQSDDSRDDSRIEWITTLLAAYWRRHPNAADTVEGVAWWIPELASESPALVVRALDVLVARKVAHKRQRADGTVIYSAQKTDPA